MELSTTLYPGAALLNWISKGIIVTYYCLILYVSKLGVPIKTTVSATVLEEALNGLVIVRSLPLGQSITRKVMTLSLAVCRAFTTNLLNKLLSIIKQVEKQSAHFYSVEITEKEARMGVICRVHSSAKGKFKVVSKSQTGF